MGKMQKNYIYQSSSICLYMYMRSEINLCWSSFLYKHGAQSHVPVAFINQLYKTVGSDSVTLQLCSTLLKHWIYSIYVCMYIFV